jgi:hypothetical protein
MYLIPWNHTRHLPEFTMISLRVYAIDCYVGPCASLRGDFGRIILERGANVQDTCVRHDFPGTDNAAVWQPWWKLRR